MVKRYLVYIKLTANDLEKGEITLVTDTVRKARAIGNGVADTLHDIKIVQETVKIIES